ncbi:MAG: RNA polymerase sigma factor region1.1 domain-containing protein [Myxococcales bacterium]
MAIVKIGKSHRARKELFQKGIRQGYLSVDEIETALPSGSLTDAERWLLYYSLRAAEVEIRDEQGASVSAPPSEEAPREAAADEAEGEAPIEPGAEHGGHHSH